jgi:hypothetical protein
MARSITSRLNTPSSAWRSELASSLDVARSSRVSVLTPHSVSSATGGSKAMRASRTISSLIACPSICTWVRMPYWSARISRNATSGGACAWVMAASPSGR